MSTTAKPTDVSRDLSLLHPIIRASVVEIINQLAAESTPCGLFEAYRSPARQAYLYSQGRTRPGIIITKAQPWESYHQYGLAVDIVPQPYGKWDWGASGNLEHYWNRLNDLGRQFGLETLAWERPHLQLAGMNIHELKRGSFPGGGDLGWYANLEREALAWNKPPEGPGATMLVKVDG